jgi:hypothetical protein
MLKRVAQLAGLTLLLGIVFVPTAQASPRVAFSLRVGPSAPYAVAPGYRPGYVWRPGYYVRTGLRSRWIAGGWVPAPYVRRNWGGERWERERRYYGRDRRWDHDRGWRR